MLKDCENEPTIEVFKFPTGMAVVSEVKYESDDSIKLKHPMIVMINGMDARGALNVTMMPLIEFSREMEVVVKRSEFTPMLKYEPSQNVKKLYMEHVQKMRAAMSGLVAPGAGRIINETR